MEREETRRVPLSHATIKSVPRRLLVFAATTGYQIRVFEQTARRMGADFTLATDHCDRLDDPWGDHAIAVKFDHRLSRSIEALRNVPFDAVAAVGDRPAVLAAEAAATHGVLFHSPAGARASNDKYLARQLYQAAGLLLPPFFRARFNDDPRVLAARAPYPCVLKPLGLSASRGVIRADDAREFEAAFRRIARFGERFLQVEGYIPGREFAIEGLVTRGEFQPLAIFDKPDPLEGPFFEETIYTTPSGEPEAVQSALIETAARAVGVLGLCHGPVHVEMRYNAEGTWILEAHARPIGGLCARALRFEGGMPLEELIIRHALGEDVRGARREGPASGVMMIPIPKEGIYRSAEGVERALAVPGIEDVVLTATEGQHIVPLPEGSSYLGFIFARAASAAEVEAALRRSHAELRFEIATVLPTVKLSP
jgi:biotin carboxylase